MDFVIEIILRPILTVIGYVVWDIVFLIILFNVSMVFLLIVSLGKYPRGEYLEKHRDRIASVGFAIVVLAWISIAVFNNFGGSEI